MSTNSHSEYLFDHLVIITRDYLDELSSKFLNQGFQLTPIAHHNLGSSNRLIMLDTSYIELLGWGKGEIPKRVEIANQPIGLDAMVFRTNDAEECYRKLSQNGFLVNPVQNLSREGEYKNEKVLVKFKTVRFQEQPIPGLRIYFCEHLTPDFVWQSQWLQHSNQVRYISKINIATHHVDYVVNQLCNLLDLKPSNLIMNPEISRIILPNIELSIHRLASNEMQTMITDINLSREPQDPVDLIINRNFFNHY
jgi:Glyoxalase-like domain